MWNIRRRTYVMNSRSDPNVLPELVGDWIVEAVRTDFRAGYR